HSGFHVAQQAIVAIAGKHAGLLFHAALRNALLVAIAIPGLQAFDAHTDRLVAHHVGATVARVLTALGRLAESGDTILVGLAVVSPDALHAFLFGRMTQQIVASTRLVRLARQTEAGHAPTALVAARHRRAESPHQ